MYAVLLETEEGRRYELVRTESEILANGVHVGAHGLLEALSNEQKIEGPAPKLIFEKVDGSIFIDTEAPGSAYQQ